VNQSHKTLTLTDEQFDALEEAADILALGHRYPNSMEDAVTMLAENYIACHGHEFEATFDESGEEEEEKKETSADFPLSPPQTAS